MSLENTDNKVLVVLNVKFLQTFQHFLQIRGAAQIKSREKGEKHIVLKYKRTKGSKNAEARELRLFALLFCLFVCFFYLGLTSVTFVSGSKALIKEESRWVPSLQGGQTGQVLVQHSNAP